MATIVLRLLLPLLLCHVAVHGDTPGSASSNPEVDSLKDKADLKYLVDKVWDVVAVTDWYGEKDPGAIEEDDYFIKALESLGRKVKRVRIDDDEFDWESTKSVVIRSAWATFSYLDEYKQFLDRVNTQAFLFNPREMIRWQSNKINYMKQLANFVKVPQTIVIRPHEEEYPSYEQAADILGCAELIIKPAQGSSGIGVKKINADNTDLYERKMKEYLYEEEEDMLIQCFMFSVTHDGPGEINVFIIDGQVTHSTYGYPAKGGYLIHEEYGGDGDVHNATEGEIDFGLKVHNAASDIVGVKPLYFRVDMMYDNDGDLTLMEIGMIDMDFRDVPAAAMVMAQALDRFLSEKESAYEQVHGHKPVLLDEATYNELEEEYECFGTPLKGGFYGKERLWEATLKGPEDKVEEEDEL